METRVRVVGINENDVFLDFRQIGLGLFPVLLGFLKMEIYYWNELTKENSKMRSDFSGAIRVYPF